MAAQGLKLNLGGASETWHVVQGVPGYFHPSIPTLVGEGKQISLEQAQELSSDPGSPVELVDVPDVAEATSALEAHVDVVRNAVHTAAREADGGEAAVVKDEVEALRESFKSNRAQKAQSNAADDESTND